MEQLSINCQIVKVNDARLSPMKKYNRQSINSLCDVLEDFNVTPLEFSITSKNTHRGTIIQESAPTRVHGEEQNGLMTDCYNCPWHR